MKSLFPYLARTSNTSQHPISLTVLFCLAKYTYPTPLNTFSPLRSTDILQPHSLSSQQERDFVNVKRQDKTITKEKKHRHDNIITHKTQVEKDIVGLSRYWLGSSPICLEFLYILWIQRLIENVKWDISPLHRTTPISGLLAIQATLLPSASPPNFAPVSSALFTLTPNEGLTQQYASGAQEESFQEEGVRIHDRMLREVGQKR